jgi:hypothetical protein
MVDLRERLVAGAGPSASPPDLDAVARGARRRVRRARRLQVGGVGLLVTAVVGAGVLSVARDDDPDTAVEVGPPSTVTDPTAPPETVATAPSSVATDVGPGSAWVPIAPSPLAEREAPAQVWTGRELIVFGGIAVQGTTPIEFGDGAAYDPAADTWRLLGDAGRPDDLVGQASAVWTGEEVLVVAHRNTEGDLRVARYDPAADTWTATAQPDVAGRDTIVHWTGAELVVLGGASGDTRSTPVGLAYSPTDDSWRVLPDPPGTPGISAWTGDHLVTWLQGDPAAEPVLASYDPAADTWRSVVVDGFAADEIPGALVWTGSELLSWPNCYDVCDVAGAAVDPVSGASRPLAAAPVPTNAELRLLDGRIAASPTSSAPALYDPATDTWMLLPVIDPARCCGAVVWSGSELLAWGGQLHEEFNPLVADGWRLAPPERSRGAASAPTTTVEADLSTAAAACTAEAILPAVERDVESSYAAIDVTIDRCAGGYARVIAAFDVPECVPGVLCLEEGATVFLAATADGWRVITWGSDVACTDTFGPRLTADLAAACEALGLS